MRLALFSARMLLEPALPRTKVTASVTLLLPAPFGPITQLYLSPNWISVNFAKLLKPCKTSLLIFVIFPDDDALLLRVQDDVYRLAFLDVERVDDGRRDLDAAILLQDVVPEDDFLHGSPFFKGLLRVLKDLKKT